MAGLLDGLRRLVSGSGTPGSPAAAPTASGSATSSEPALVAEWSRPAPILEYRLAGPGKAVLHVERKVKDRAGLVRTAGKWLVEHELSLEEFVYSPAPGGRADMAVVAGGAKDNVVRALAAASGPESLFDKPHPRLGVPEKRHTARCTLYVPEELLTQNILVSVGEAALQACVEEVAGLPYANISYLSVERSPYAAGVPGYQVDVFLTADSRAVLGSVIENLEAIREPMGALDSWTMRTWPCACPDCAAPRG